MRSFRSFRFALALSTAAVVACGGDDESSGASGTTTGAGASGSGGEGGSTTTTTTTGTGGMPPGSLPGAPVALYTDLASAPPGSYVTVWGRRFGASQASSTITVAGAPVDVVSWTDRRIELALPQSAVSGDLVVTTTEGDSPPLALGVHAGAIYFVASNGNDAWSGTLDAPAGADGPFETLHAGVAALAPGDVLYLRANTFTQEDDFNAVLSLYELPIASADAPIAIAAYPGEAVTLGDGTLQRGISLYHGDGMPNLSNLTIAKLKFLPACDAIELVYADHGRFVGNEVSGATDACQNGVVEAQGTSGWKVLGNSLHDNGNTKLEHGIYLGGYGVQKDWEIAWNTIANQAGGRAIQLYGHTPQDRIESISIHDNEIVDVDRDGIVLGATDADVLHLDGILIYDNVFVRAGRCTGHGVRVGNDTAQNVSIVGNTFFDNGSGVVACDQSAGSPGGQILLEAGADVAIVDNVLAAVGDEVAIDEAATPPSLVVANNLYAGADASPHDGAPVVADPGFADASTLDLHVGPTSPAKGKGVATSVLADHDGVARADPPTIGAYEASEP